MQASYMIPPEEGLKNLTTIPILIRLKKSHRYKIRVKKQNSKLLGKE